jgi:hypothetical protein
MWDEPDDLEDADADFPAVRYEDPLSEALGAVGYIDRYVVDECRETFPESRVIRFPERFDRFYFMSNIGPVLVDILVGDLDGQESQRTRKHVRFKAEWCAAHDRRYVVLTEDEAADVAKAHVRLAAPVVVEEREATVRPGNAQTPVKRGPGRPRGSVSRPKAEAAV